MESTALPAQDDTEPEYPPLLQQVRNNMLKFSHCVLVTRVGGFYEVCARLFNVDSC
jgi:DNA mismatch repair ATPase MutS